MKLSKMSLAIIAAAGLLSLASSVRAEDPAPPAPTTPPAARRGGAARLTADAQLKVLTEKLKLTDEQQPKVKAVIEEQIKARQGARDIPQEERAAKMKAMRDENTKKMKEVLTADQFKQYEELQKQMGPGGRRNADPAAAAPADGGAKKKKAE